MGWYYRDTSWYSVDHMRDRSCEGAENLESYLSWRMGHQMLPPPNTLLENCMRKMGERRSSSRRNAELGRFGGGDWWTFTIPLLVAS